MRLLSEIEIEGIVTNRRCKISKFQSVIVMYSTLYQELMRKERDIHRDRATNFKHPSPCISQIR
jgi:hypothetical protein